MNIDSSVWLDKLKKKSERKIQQKNCPTSSNTVFVDSPRFAQTTFGGFAKPEHFWRFLSIRSGDPKVEVLNDIAFELDIDALLVRLHIDKESEDAKDIQHLIDHVASLVKPKAIYEVSYIQYKGYDTVAIGGVTFTSRVLRVNLDKIERVFPYIATCGKELEKIVAATDDFMRRFWLDTIKDMALKTSVKYLGNYLKRRYALGQMSKMSPGAGSQDLWPIEQQKQLFSIFGNVEDLIGVKLTDSFLMIPNKSVSGIYFPTEIKFESCQLCPRQGCPARRVPYEKNLLEAKYHKG